MARGHGDHRHLVAAGRQHREAIVVAEQLVGDALHVDEVFRIGADAAQNAEDELDEQRPGRPARDRGNAPAYRDGRHRSTRIRTACRSPRRAVSGSVSISREGVLEDRCLRVALQQFGSQSCFQSRGLVERRIEAEIHRAHVERAHFRLGHERAQRGGRRASSATSRRWRC